MSLKHLLIGLSFAALAATSCKTPRGQSALKSDVGSGDDDEAFFASKASCQARMGLRLGRGMEVTAIDETSYADVMEVHVGDVIHTLNGENVGTPADFEATCLEIGAKRPALWRFGVTRDGVQDELGGNWAMECDYLTMVGCAPIPPRTND